jgi:chromosome condensin MukBEF MukE localization factor
VTTNAEVEKELTSLVDEVAELLKLTTTPSDIVPFRQSLPALVHASLTRLKRHLE